MRIDPTLPVFESDDASQRRLEELSREFEAVLLAEVLQALSDSVGGSGSDSEAPGSRLEGILWQELARQLAVQRPLGLAEAVYRQLETDESNPAANRELSPAHVGSTPAVLDTSAASGSSHRESAPERTSTLSTTPSSTSAEPARESTVPPVAPMSVPTPAPNQPTPSEAQSSSGFELPVAGRLTSGFGYRTDPFNHSRRFHRGHDFAAMEGTSVRASADGEVVFAGPRSGYGNTVILRHPDGVETLYAHLRQVDVRVGERVQGGSVLGGVGQTGRATGPHLHFEVRRNGDAEDPDEWI